jgi:hypothetical protein
MRAMRFIIFLTYNMWCCKMSHLQYVGRKACQRLVEKDRPTRPTDLHLRLYEQQGEILGRARL